MSNENTELLQEIFIKPANEIKADRFVENANAAPCSGACSGGMCRTVNE